MNSSIKTNKIPMGQKIAFGFGMLANQMFPAILGIFMIVLVEDLGFSGWMWSLVFLFPRIFDAFLDPIMGFISDNTKSKWGRRRRYVLIGGIAQNGEPFKEKVKAKMESSILNIYKNKIEVKISTLHDKNAAVLGAASLVWKTII